MPRSTLPCIACGRLLNNVSGDTEGNQPYAGIAFTSHGHYGSTIYDPMDGHFLEVNICDACLAIHTDRVLEGRDSQPIILDGSIHGFENVDRHPLKPWAPAKYRIKWALNRSLTNS